jgi:hypothetical protein
MPRRYAEPSKRVFHNDSYGGMVTASKFYLVRWMLVRHRAVTQNL